MFGYIMTCRGIERRFMPQPDLTYTFVDEEGQEFPTVKVDGYYFPVDDDGTVSDGYDLQTGERVFVHDMHTNEQCNVVKDVLSFTYRYALVHKQMRGVQIQRVEVM